MRKSILSISAAIALALAASAVQAMPLSGNVDGISSPEVVLVAGGCGAGFHSGPGGCVPNGAVVARHYWRGAGWRFYNGCWRGPAGRVHCG